MKLVCLLYGCQWRNVLTDELAGLKCECCERCGALRHRHCDQPVNG
ncbi:PSPA7_2676 family Cys-rich small protein [Pseudomonas vanderleydeniana]|nr:PSPA7_2676 family Cys-rich small protein [Pseudomonas vanderleydeniana]